MIESSLIRCDGPNCSQVKGETNHWWAIAKRDDPDSAFYAVPFEKVFAERIPMMKHFCGQVCALKYFSNWMTKVSR